MKLAFLGMTGAKADVTVKGAPSPVAGLVITRSYVPKGKLGKLAPEHKGHRVTHAASLLALTKDTDAHQLTFNQAAALAGFLAPLADWTADADAIAQQTSRAKVAEAVTRALTFMGVVS